MKISTLLKTTATITFILIMVNGWSIYSLLKHLESETDALALDEEVTSLVNQLQSSSDYITNEVRAYTQFGEKEHYDNYWKEVEETQTQERIFHNLQQLEVPTELLELIEFAYQNSSALVSLEEEAIQAVAEGDFEEARFLVFGPKYKINKGIIEQSLVEFNTKLASWTDAKVAKTKQNVHTGLIILIVSASLVIVSILIAFILLYMKVKPLAKLTQAADEIASGNLKIDSLTVKSKDEVAQLASSFNQMAINLREILTTVSRASENLTASSEQLAASTAQTSEAAHQVSSSIEEVANGANLQLQQIQESTQTITEVSRGLQLIAHNTSSVAQSSEETTQKSQMGEKSITQAIGQMRTIEETVKKTAQSIVLLNERSKEIEKIIIAISNIADQTNLLALNAAIEAARAGEHGKGFAVVADEVRKLAVQSNTSAQHITQIIQSIQSDTLATVTQMNHVTESVLDGVKMIEHTGGAFKEILDSTYSIASQIQEVSAISEQIAASADQVNTSFELVMSITENTASKAQTVAGLSEEQYASVEEITGSTDELSKLALTLNDEVGKFKF
ncbi:methyl-accepting chemotaxis protein [Lysinibacillus sp. KU-BSD001]|uniref:methyl-accepting chemotaxis protein n=1 Tax=Lysinibacillus sp. KU-BSD001 TaxID=3141328 RepID=UPI0036E22BBD